MLLVKTKLRSSSVHGIGVFADEFIPKGTITWRLAPGFDIFINEEEFNLLPSCAKDHFLNYCYIDKHSKMMILCFDNERFMNHSDNPNIVEGGVQSDFGSIDVAVRDIHPGEELLCNYYEFDADAGRKLPFDIKKKKIRELKLGVIHQKIVTLLKRTGSNLNFIFKNQIKNKI